MDAIDATLRLAAARHGLSVSWLPDFGYVARVGAHSPFFVLGRTPSGALLRLNRAVSGGRIDG